MPKQPTMEELVARVQQLEQGLSDIMNPIKRLYAESETEGYAIDGRMAMMLSNDPEYLKSIAKDTLAGLPDGRMFVLRADASAIKSQIQSDCVLSYSDLIEEDEDAHKW